LQLTGEDGWWSLDPGEAVAARPGVKARWGAAVSGYLQKEEEEGEGEQRRWPAWRRAMVAWRLPARTKMGRGRLGPASIGRFIAHAEDDAATGGGQVGNITWQAGPALASAPLTGGTQRQILSGLKHFWNENSSVKIARNWEKNLKEFVEEKGVIWNNFCNCNIFGFFTDFELFTRFHAKPNWYSFVPI
jgi:hypothetical protein